MCVEYQSHLNKSVFTETGRDNVLEASRDNVMEEA